jgi:hypothetical protein
MFAVLAVAINSQYPPFQEIEFISQSERGHCDKLYLLRHLAVANVGRVVGARFSDKLTYLGTIAKSYGPEPAGKGDPGSGVSAPDESEILKPEMLRDA